MGSNRVNYFQSVKARPPQEGWFPGPPAPACGVLYDRCLALQLPRPLVAADTGDPRPEGFHVKNIISLGFERFPAAVQEPFSHI